MVNIILDKTVIRSATTTTQNDLTDIRFYIPKEYSKNVFVACFDSQIVPMTLASEAHSKYDIYQLSAIAEDFGTESVYIIMIDTSNGTATTTNTLELNVSKTKYIQSCSALVTVMLDKDVYNYFEKIKKMTELNIDIYNKLHESEE